MPNRETRRFVLNHLQSLEEKHLCYLVVNWFVDDVEAYYKKRSPTEVIYTFNPKWLHRKLNKEIKHEKLSVARGARARISSIIRALLTKNKLEYYTTKTSSGCTSYHIVLNPQVVKQMKRWRYHITLEAIYASFHSALT